MKLEQKFRSRFCQKLIDWYRENRRDLPWRRTSDPYKIWISEIMLQQTQVDTVIPYYNRFLKMFPDLETLARAPLSKVLKAWEGLGYYARARNLHGAAQAIVRDRRGAMPSTHDALLAVPGIGPYTAAALASIAFNENYPVVDGNVLRVLARLFKIADPPSRKGSKSRFVNAARQLLPAGQASDFNQAMMELGALVCLPARPRCDQCPVTFFCLAYQTMDDPALLPVREPRKKRPHYDIAVGVIWREGKLLIIQRPTDGMLGGLWEFPGGRQEQGETPEACVAREIRQELGIEVRVKAPLSKVPHAYTHFKITLHPFLCDYVAGEVKPGKAIAHKWVRPKAMVKFAFPTSNRKILKAVMESMQ